MINFGTRSVRTRQIKKHKLYSLIFIIIYVSVTSLTQGQVVPSLGDPFNGANPGPELPKTTPAPYRGCPVECDIKLTEAIANIAELEKRITTLNITVTSRLNNVPTNGGSGTGNNNEISNRVINVENYLYGNMTMVTNKLNSDLAAARTTLTQNITDTRKYLEDRISSSSNGVPMGVGTGGNPTALYSNITARLDNLEFNKVKTLIDENDVWRRNFEVVNKTFSKMKKSSYSNEVIVVGK